MNDKVKLAIGGSLIGLIAVCLVYFGNPANMGFCIACFIRDIAGGIGIHRAEVVQYVRPEIIGLVVGAFIMAVAKKEFSAKGGSSPLLRFVLGFFVMIGALMFLGCPLRMALRLAGGDLNAIFGLLGFIVGIGGGAFFLNKGYTLKRTYDLPKLEGAAFTIINILLLVLVIAVPALFFVSVSGPGSMYAPLLISLAAGLIVGGIAQRIRLCMVGGIRNIMLFQDWTLICGFVSLIVMALIGNILFGYFKLGFADQPVAHTDGLWNFLGMLTVGFGSVLLGGCPLRQLILSGEGNSDSAITVLGMFVGAAICHNFSLASSPAGPTFNGKIGVIIGIAVMFIIAITNINKKEQES